MGSIVDDIDVHRFEAYWDNISKNEKVDLIASVDDSKADIAIQLVLKGIDSPHFSVRAQARKTLDAIKKKIKSQLKDRFNQLQWNSGMKGASQVCSKIFSRIKSGTSVEEQRSFFKLLLEIDGKGAGFAFKTVCMQRISLNDAGKMMLTMSDLQRLDFISEYLKADPDLRLKFGEFFKRIVRSIKNTKAVVNYFARLFDTEQDVDPFLYNLPLRLRQPDQIVSEFVQSPSPEIRSKGLKALAMIVPKINPEILLGILAKEKNAHVRKTIYKIIENSTLGTYPEIFDSILKQMEDGEDEEKFYAVKALIVSGKEPLINVVIMIRDNHPSLMDPLFDEISKLSKISFFFIQDMALNKKAYEGPGNEINQAAIFGMIKKRPERIVNILQLHQKKSDQRIQKETALFIRKTKQLLARENQFIEKAYHPVISKVKKIQSEEPEGIIKTLFSSSPLKKGIDALEKNKRGSVIDFGGEPIIDLDLSSRTYLPSAIYFSTSVIKNTDFSNASFFNTFFKKSIFFNVDFQKSKFDSVFFDNAILINVNANDAVFKNCSFQNVHMFNCTFDRAKMRGASFVCATLSKSSFQDTDLSFSLFSYSNIQAVTFVNSNLEQADFSGVKARFSRFPAQSRTSFFNDDIDLNARKFQLKKSDLPSLDKALILHINQLIFSEFIQYGEKKFSRQNKYSLMTAYDIFKPRQADLFQIIPYLLHENVTLPGIRDIFSKKTPHGIFDYHPGPEIIKTISRYARGEKIKVNSYQTPAIEALFTIGSIGSVAQSSDSDIDYWVCIYEDRFNPSAIQLLQKKLEAVEAYAWNQFHVQITFFLVDIVKTRDNNFGDTSFESSGSAQAMLLKEEFYRTMIHVAGKLPLWTVLPTSISRNYYTDILKMVSTLPNLARYIDLGDIHDISTQEFFGASIWQMFKSLKSPFKSVIKMALIEKYVYEHGKTPLLCNIYKDEWMNSGVNLKLLQNDAYYILLKYLLKYYAESKDKDSISLLLTCFFLKLGIAKTAEVDKTVFGLRKIILENCMEKWGWTRDKLFKIGVYKSWPYKNIVGLSNTLEAYVIKKYKFLNTAFEKLYSGSARISPEDRTVLGRKVYSELSRKPGKISKILLVSNSDSHFDHLHLMYGEKAGQIGSWELIKKIRRGEERTELLIKSPAIEEIGAWLIINKIYNKSFVINLLPNPTKVTIDEIRKLFKTLYDYFGPMVKKPVGFDQLLKKDDIAGLFVSINFYAPSQQRQITDFTIIYMNTWGEMFFKSYRQGRGLPSIEAVKKMVLDQLKIKTIPQNSICYFRGLAKKFK